MTNPDLDFFAELDAELATIMAKSKKAAQLKAARKKANNSRLPSATRQAAKSEFLALQSEVEASLWVPTASIALFTEQICDGCGSIHRTFLQFMELQTRVSKSSTQRWIRTSKPHPALPRETMIQPLTTHICADCCIDHGFDFHPDSTRLEISTSLTVSPNYIQEDINASN